jgi:hypothetical protein
MPWSMSPSRSERAGFEPGDLLLHPVALGALGLWLLNDHVLKWLVPCWLTGKLSDVACLVACPLLVVAAAEIGWPRMGLRAHRLVLLVSLFVFGAIMASIRVSPMAADVYRYGLGAAQWCAVALVHVFLGRDLPTLLPVQLTMDVTDILTIPSLFVPAVLVSRLRPPGVLSR